MTWHECVVSWLTRLSNVQYIFKRDEYPDSGDRESLKKMCVSCYITRKGGQTDLIPRLHAFEDSNKKLKSMQKRCEKGKKGEREKEMNQGARKIESHGDH